MWQWSIVALTCIVCYLCIIIVQYVTQQSSFGALCAFICQHHEVALIWHVVIERGPVFIWWFIIMHFSQLQLL